jgi:endonuclease/exonuclease/phosphatase family metal-dependent hydrolase
LSFAAQACTRNAPSKATAAQEAAPAAEGEAPAAPNAELGMIEPSAAGRNPSEPNAKDRAPPATGPKTRLRIATWNMQWLAAEPGRGRIKRSEADYARLRAQLARLDADVIAFQEVAGPEAALRVVPEADYAVHFSSRRDPLRTGFAYRRKLDVDTLPDLAELDVGGLRHGTQLRIRGGSSELTLLNVHLKSGCWDSYLSSKRAACVKLSLQLPILENSIDARARIHEPLMIVGDFNRQFEVPDEFWRELDDGEPKASDLIRLTEGRRPQCWNAQHPAFIDHLVVTQDAARFVVADSFREWLYEANDPAQKKRLSDHCALSVDVEL